MDDEVEAIENAQAMVSNRSCPKCKEEKFLSTIFGDSSIIIDWCSSCHSIWLDKNEFQEIIEFLKEKLNNLSIADMRRKLSEEVKEVWSGPEDKWSEILDAKAALWALTSITIFDQPKLYKRLSLLRSSQLVGQFGSAVKAYFGV
jgi:Zn-finger nucleic acid-binding protein